MANSMCCRSTHYWGSTAPFQHLAQPSESAPLFSSFVQDQNPRNACPAIPRPASCCHCHTQPITLFCGSWGHSTRQAFFGIRTLERRTCCASYSGMLGLASMEYCAWRLRGRVWQAHLLQVLRQVIHHLQRDIDADHSPQYPYMPVT